MKVLFCGSGWLPIVDAIAARRPDDSVEVWDRSSPLEQAVRGVDVILPSNGPISADVIAAAEALVLIQQPASGYDGVDLEAARKRQIPVCNAPGANTVAVAEAATFLILALARKVNVARKSFANAQIGVPLGIELQGRTLGLIGYGASAKALASIASGLAMRVISVNSRSSPDELSSLLAESDVVSLHCPLSERTHGLVDVDFLGGMKRGALLINCARGPIVDREAVKEALASGHLGGLGLDTYWQEPWDPTDPLFALDNVVTLPHVAGSTEESFDRIADIVCENIRRVEQGLSPLHCVNS